MEAWLCLGCGLFWILRSSVQVEIVFFRVSLLHGSNFFFMPIKIRSLMKCIVERHSFSCRYFSLNFDEKYTPFFSSERATSSFSCEIMALISMNLVMYNLMPCFRFQKSVSIALVFMKNEYCFRNAYKC